MLFFATCAVHAKSPAGTQAGSVQPPEYDRAKQELDALPHDARRNMWREPWEVLADKFMSLYNKEKNWVNRPAALYRSAVALDELARRSGRLSDLDVAESRYQLLWEKHAASVLADDALYRAALLLAEKKHDTPSALRLLDQLVLQYPKGDMLAEATALAQKLDPGHKPEPVDKNAKKGKAGQNAKASPAKTPDGKTSAATDVKGTGAKAAGDSSAKNSTGKTSGSKTADTKSSGGKAAPARQETSAKQEVGERKIPMETPTRVFKGKSELLIRRVLLDPGHGGNDPGTHHNGILERKFTFEMARRVGDILAAHGITVLYTRQGDHWLSLEDRARRVRTSMADIFVSLHVNANLREAVQGFETYYMDYSRISSATRLATVENAIQKRPAVAKKKFPASKLVQMQEKESTRLAWNIQSATLNRLHAKKHATVDGGIKMAPFYVLRQAGVPAVLVEMGYCTNNAEAKLLAQKDYKADMARGIAEGILAYAGKK